MIIKNKKCQFMILSTMFLILLLLFIYYQETDNFYIIFSDKTIILNNIVYETCQVGKMSNGSFIDNRFSNFSFDVNNYCNSRELFCNLIIVKKSGAPTNLSLLNYSFYDYSINYSGKGFSSKFNFTC